MQLPTSTSTSSASNFRRPSLSAFRYPTAPETTVHTDSASSTAQISCAYRRRYASYLAASFGISFEAALADTDAQLAPRRSSYVSESEVDRRE
ncbi:hypothetical protein M438DRAFT_284984 [Aureobasidium pullulans EXF-150]|uniref:Uncharacterized protein n=1 Tax=Aureobasidium pullulans EXF-150 TaxID=1043002 RepID=A0A074X000_AURPU|nr:uncharacterized protein M438DRAFT_284984 [Aureobasidium pullulans EXF-150]KEQ78775.1 hypothetical protein M438DRAFT_284984 [Aureobasidium pullulans EXF-150]